MTLKDIREWLKPQIEGLKACYSGTIDNSKECIVGLYNRSSSKDSIAIGGLNNTSSATKRISVLVHWNKNYDTSEIKAKSIYDLFCGKKATIGDRECFFNMLNDEPIGIGKNDLGVFEFVIDVDITYKRG